MEDKIWTKSIREEIICVLWLVPTILSYGFGIKWLMWFCAFWSVLAYIASISYSFLEKKTKTIKQIKIEQNN